MKKNNLELFAIGKRLRTLRQSISLSRKEMQIRHGISANTLKAWEVGQVEIGISRLMKYLKILEQYHIMVPLDQLLQTTENYLDNLLPSDSVKFFRNNLIAPTASFANNGNNEVELICNLFVQEMNNLLQEKDKVLRALIDNIPLKIFIKDDKNFFLYVNNQAAKKFGGVPSDFERRSCYDVFPTTAKKFHDDDLKSITTNTNLRNIVESFKTIDGRTVWVNTDKTPILYPERNKKMVLGIFSMIDDPKS